MEETHVWSLGWEDILEKGMATHSSILAWRIPWTEDPGGLQSMGSQKVGHDWIALAYTDTGIIYNIYNTFIYLNYIFFFIHSSISGPLDCFLALDVVRSTFYDLTLEFTWHYFHHTVSWGSHKDPPKIKGRGHRLSFSIGEWQHSKTAGGMGNTIRYLESDAWIRNPIIYGFWVSVFWSINELIIAPISRDCCEDWMR